MVINGYFINHLKQRKFSAAKRMRKAPQEERAKVPPGYFKMRCNPGQIKWLLYTEVAAVNPRVLRRKLFPLIFCEFRTRLNIKWPPNITRKACQLDCRAVYENITIGMWRSMNFPCSCWHSRPRWDAVLYQRLEPYTPHRSGVRVVLDNV